MAARKQVAASGSANASDNNDEFNRRRGSAALGRPRNQLMSNDSRPNSKEVAGRLVILKAVAMYAGATPPKGMLEGMRAARPDQWPEFVRMTEAAREKLCASLRDAGLWEQVSPREREFLSASIERMTQAQHIDASWRLEAAQVLMWALGLISELPPYDTRAQAALLKAIPKSSQLFPTARLRDDPAIDRARDLAELWHWRSRTRQLIEKNTPFPQDAQTRKQGITSFDDIVRVASARAAENGDIPPCVDNDFPAFGKAYRDLSSEQWAAIRSITMERHTALNWLCGYAPENQWDQTPTDT